MENLELDYRKVETIMSGTVHMENFRNTKHKAIVASRDLGYSEGTIQQLHYAKTESEILRIMVNARKRGC